MGFRKHLPVGRWARALTALLGYLLAVLLGGAVLTSIIGGVGGLSLGIGLAFLLLVPLAVVALPAREFAPSPEDHLPVLMRSKARKLRIDQGPQCDLDAGR